MIEVYMGLYFLMQDRSFTAMGPLTLEEAADVLIEYMTGGNDERKAIACSGYMVTDEYSMAVEYGELPVDYDILGHIQNHKDYWLLSMTRELHDD